MGFAVAESQHQNYSHKDKKHQALVYGKQPSMWEVRVLQLCSTRHTAPSKVRVSCGPVQICTDSETSVGCCFIITTEPLSGRDRGRKRGTVSRDRVLLYRVTVNTSVWSTAWVWRFTGRSTWEKERAAAKYLGSSTTTACSAQLTLEPFFGIQRQAKSRNRSSSLAQFKNGHKPTMANTPTGTRLIDKT